MDDFHHTLCYQLNCCHIIIKMIQLHPSLFCIVLYFRKIILYSRVSHRDRSLFGANIIESFCEGKEPFFVTLRQVCDQDRTFKEMVAQRNRNIEAFCTYENRKKIVKIGETLHKRHLTFEYFLILFL